MKEVCFVLSVERGFHIKPFDTRYLRIQKHIPGKLQLPPENGLVRKVGSPCFNAILKQSFSKQLS